MIRDIAHSLRHVFVSYSHHDIAECHQVLERLHEAGIPIWHDDSIEAGEKWKPQIDEALEDAFAIVVVVTPKSMQSLYVTYEWSWAIGSNIPVFPLLLSGSYEDVHSRLLDEHCEDCREGIPDSLVQAIHDKQNTPPDIEYLNKLIHALTQPLRVYLRVVIWLYSHSSESDTETFKELLKHLAEYADRTARHDLPNLIIDKSHAFTRKQKQRCRSIVEATSELAIRVNFMFTYVEKREHEAKTLYAELMVWLEKYYTEKWLIVTDALDETHSMVEILDDYLGYKHENPDDKEKRIKTLIEMYRGRIPEDEIRTQETDPRFLETKRVFAYGVVRRAYKEDELGNAVWELIEHIKNNPL